MQTGELIHMKFFKKVFARNEPQETPEDILKITRELSPLLDDVANRIFSEYRSTLVVESVAYVVPAVWGAMKDGELDDTQKEMNKKISPVVEKIYDTIELNGLQQGQVFAVKYLIRGLIISKIIYLVEIVKQRAMSEANCEARLSGLLDQIGPLGSA